MVGDETGSVKGRKRWREIQKKFTTHKLNEEESSREIQEKKK